MGEAIVRQELQSVVDAFQSYPTFEAEFAKGQGEADPVEEFKRRRKCESKVAQLMIDFLYDVLPESMTAALRKPELQRGPSPLQAWRTSTCSKRKVSKPIASSTALSPLPRAPWTRTATTRCRRRTASRQLRRYRP